MKLCVNNYLLCICIIIIILSCIHGINNFQQIFIQQPTNQPTAVLFIYLFAGCCGRVVVVQYTIWPPTVSIYIIYLSAYL